MSINNSSDLIYSILIGISLGLIAFLTAVGNLIVILAFYHDKKLRTINDYFIMNMAIADFLVGFFCIPFYIPFSIKQIWPFGRLFCQIWVTVDDVATMASVINIVAISVNRYWLIAYPISYRKYIRQDLVYLAMGAIWFISFINFAPGIWLMSLFDNIDEKRNDCSGDYNRSFVYMLIAQFNYFICPFILLCILNFLIMCNIWKRTRRISRLRSFNNNSFYKLNKSSSNNTNYHYQSNSHQIIKEKCKSLSNSQQRNSNKIKLIRESSPIIRNKSSSIHLLNYLDKPINLTNENSSKDCRSSPTVLLSIKCSNNKVDDSIIDYNIQTNAQIMRRLKDQIKDTRRIAQRDLRISRDRKAARSLFILVIVFLIFLFPYVICSTASTAGFIISETLFQVSFWLLWLNSTCNPFLYPFIQTKYRRAYAKLFQSCFKQSH